MVKKRITSQDVANLAGVSRTTVSFVLNDVKDLTLRPKHVEKFTMPQSIWDIFRMLLPKLLPLVGQEPLA